MKRFAILLLLIGFALANVDASVKIVPLEGSHVSDQYRAPRLPSSKTTLIGAVGDTRTILGPTAKNIVVSKNGEAIGIMYCPPSSPYNGQEAFGEVRIAYSLDMGATFTNYGPFNGLAPLRRTYPGIDGSKDFDTQAGELFFAWQEGPAGYPSCDGWMAIEENLPSSPSFSSPQQFGTDVWMPCVCVDPDDPLHVMITYWDYLPSGNNNNYIVHSTDGGYTWGDTILVAEAIGSWISSGHLRMGMDDYAFFTYHDTYTGVEYPYYVESTDVRTLTPGSGRCDRECPSTGLDHAALYELHRRSDLGDEHLGRCR
jgi:hypothetical protein